MSIVFVLVHSHDALEILQWASTTCPELYRVTSGHLAIHSVDNVSEFVVFDGPVLVLGREAEYTRLLDLERGVERHVLSSDLEKALDLKILENAF